MADYLIHKSKTGIADTAEWQETDLHYVQNQAAGDILYAADGTHLTRLAKATDGNVLVLASGVPAWSALKLDDLTAPDDNTDLDASTSKHGLVVKATAPGAGIYNYVGITNAETAYTNKALFDATVPSTQAIADSAAAGSAAVAARRDHKHAMPSQATMDTASVAAVAAAGVTLAATKKVNLGVDGSMELTTLATTLDDGKYQGITVPGVIGTAAGQIFGDLCYFNPATNKWLLADADAVATALGTLGICVIAGAENDASKYLLWGKVRADAAFPTFTALTTQYMSGTAGDITETAPSGSIGIIRCVGFSNNANELFFNPSTDYFTLAA